MKKHSKTRVLTATLILAALVLAGTPVSAGGGNPLDSVGVEHNVYLGCLMRDGGDPKVSPLQRLVEKCGFDPGTSTEEFVATYSPLVELDPYLTVAERLMPYKEAYTPYQFSYFTRIDQVIASAQNAAEADAMFAKLENEAIARLTTRTTAERSIFAALSIARHSLQYWTQATGITGAVVWTTKPGGKPAQEKIGKFLRLLIVVACDIVGGVAAGQVSDSDHVVEGVSAGASAGAAAALNEGNGGAHGGA
jgi:hypothetical protein